ncbi:MAG: metallophosphatase [Chitinophagaceae bacterium]
MRNTSFWWVLIGCMIALDLYVFQVMRTMMNSAGHKTRLIVFSGYWAVSVISLVVLLILPYLHFDQQHKLVKNTLFAVIVGLFFAKVVAALFFLIDDLRRGIQWMAGKLFFSNTEGETLQEGEKINRSAFLSWAGTIAGSGLFGSLIYGFGNKYRYRLHRLKLSFQNLPAGFKGIKIVQISDIHSGSFTDKHAVSRGVDKILAEKPDLILFTGDLVNNVSDEIKDYLDVFSRLQAPMGVFSILGNHDYGDYVHWETTDEKKANLEQLKIYHQQMGWKLLMNEHAVLEKANDKIALIGIENWSAKARFPKYGNMAHAYKGTEQYPFKILMSHDPSHWDAQVRPHYPDIDLMLSGHTHGLQFGVELPGFKWSPVQYIYKQWAGLYQEAHQKLYVNRGFGFIGYPGRVGILPEITVIELV